MVFFYKMAQPNGIVRRTHGKDAVQSCSGNIGYKGFGANGQHQFVIADGFFLVGTDPAEGDGFRGRIHPNRFHPGFHRDAGEPRIFFRGVDNQVFPRGDIAAYIVGQTATRIGNILAFGVDRDLGAAILAFELGGGFGSGRHTADDDDFHIPLDSFVLFSRLIVA